ncbi:hypothetical protein Pan258_07630 [Symmachiella dynata]|nr:hypothetical protein Pan258_07630 [Symmachiella dynata]
MRFFPGCVGCGIHDRDGGAGSQHIPPQASPPPRSLRDRNWNGERKFLSKNQPRAKLTIPKGSGTHQATSCKPISATLLLLSMTPPV